jgi:hypothetical protein
MNPMATDNAAVPNLPLEPQPSQPGAVANGELRPEEAAAAIGRLEGLVREIRGALDASAREQEHREFSVARLLAAVAEALAIGFLLWAALNWLMATEPGEGGAIVIKLLFATVLQLMALTAFFLSRPQR